MISYADPQHFNNFHFCYESSDSEFLGALSEPIYSPWFFSRIQEPNYFFVFKFTPNLLFLKVLPRIFPLESDLDELADADHCDESDISSRHLLSEHLYFPYVFCVTKFPVNQLHNLLLYLLLFFLQLLIWLIWSKLLCTLIDYSWGISRVKCLSISIKSIFVILDSSENLC